MRVFVAINPTDEVRRRLYRAAAALREADYPIRWVPPDNIHLTLKFLGEVDEGSVDAVRDAIADALAGTAAFELHVAGFGAFPSARSPRVVWVGAEGGQQLEDVHDRVEGALARLGHPRETRAFHPHLTLGRARRGTSARQFKGMEDAFASLEFDASFRVDSVDLMRSTLRPSGAEYDIVDRVELGR